MRPDGLDPTGSSANGWKGTLQINRQLWGLQCPLGQKGGAEGCKVLASVRRGGAATNEPRAQHKLLRGALVDWVPKGTRDTTRLSLRRGGREGPLGGNSRR